MLYSWYFAWLEAKSFRDKANYISIPPISLQGISFLAGGAKSNVISKSLVSATWAFDSSLEVLAESFYDDN